MPENILRAMPTHSLQRWTAISLAVIMLAACASKKAPEDLNLEVKKAEDTLTSFRNDLSMNWMRANMHNARAIMVSPNVFQAGFIVGGSGGRAMVIARHDRTQWSGPAFYKLASGSLGLQAGAQASEMVALLMTDKAVNSMLSNSFKFGGDVSVAAGPVGAGTAAPVNADIVIFTRSKGLYGGVNLDGSVISVDDKSNATFYKKAVTPTDILIKHSVTNPAAAGLLKAAQ